MSRARVVLASFDRVPSAKGASHHILANARILRDRYDVSLVTLGDAPLSGLRHLAIPLRETNWLKRALAFQAHVAAVFEEGDFDIHHVRSPWEGHAVPVDKPLVYEVNGLPSIELAYAYPVLLSRPELVAKLRILENALLDRAQLVVTPSPVTRQYLVERGVEEERIALVPNTPSIPIGEGPLAGPTEGPARIVYAGTLSAWQGVDELVAVLARIDRPFHLTVVAAQPDKRLERQLERRLPGRWTMHHGLHGDALVRVLHQQDIGVAPLVACARNLVQGCMPIKLLDYMAAGLAVVAPDMPVVRHVLGDAHPLYQRHGRRSFGEALVHVIDDVDDRRRLALAGRERVRASFSPAAQAGALLAAYARIAS